MKQLMALGILLSAACAPTAAPDDHAPPAFQGECNADKAQALVGRPATTDLAAEAQRLSGADTVRWLRPGQVITMEFRADRLNIHIDDNNTVFAIRCG